MIRDDGLCLYGVRLLEPQCFKPSPASASGVLTLHKGKSWLGVFGAVYRDRLVVILVCLLAGNGHSPSEYICSICG